MQLPSKEDWCTALPEYWPQWVSLFRWKLLYIGDFCKDHDTTCSSTRFFKAMFHNKIVCGILIATVGSLGCWVLYPYRMIKRLLGKKTEDFDDVLD